LPEKQGLPCAKSYSGSKDAWKIHRNNQESKSRERMKYSITANI